MQWLRPRRDVQAAACELEEEAHLHKGTWYTLMKDGDTLVGAGKYSTQKFYPYLVVDPVVKGQPRGLDDGEYVEYIRGVTLDQVRAVGSLCPVGKRARTAMLGWRPSRCAAAVANKPHRSLARRVLALRFRVRWRVRCRRHLE